MRKWRRVRVVGNPATIGLAVLMLTALGGCADFRRALSVGEAGVNIESPVAPLALEASHGRFAYPSFAKVPPAPKDTPPAAAFKSAVVAQADAGAQLARWTMANPQTVHATDAFVAHARREGLQAGAAAPVDDTKAAEAFAAKLRAAAAPPPPPPIR